MKLREGKKYHQRVTSIDLEAIETIRQALEHRARGMGFTQRFSDLDAVRHALRLQGGTKKRQDTLACEVILKRKDNTMTTVPWTRKFRTDDYALLVAVCKRLDMPQSAAFRYAVRATAAEVEEVGVN